MNNNPQEIMDAITTLVEFEVKILESISELKNLEMLGMTNTEAYQDEQQKLQLYSAKENRILERIDCLPYDFEAHYQVVVTNLHNYVPTYIDEDQQLEISARLMQIFGDKCKELAQKNIPNDLDDEEVDEEEVIFAREGYGESDLYESINMQIDIMRLIKLQESIEQETNEAEKNEMIEEKYSLIYENKKILDQLIQSNMNPNFLFILPDDIQAKELDIDIEKFTNQRSQQMLDYIEVFMEMLEPEELEEITDIENTLKQNCDLSFIYYLLTTLSTNLLSEQLIDYQSEYSQSEELQYKVLAEFVETILNQRTDYIPASSELLENKTCNPLSEETLEKFISLIKLAEFIVNQHRDLCSLEKQEFKETEEYIKIKNTLASYLEFEKDILDTFTYTSNEAVTLSIVLNEYLELFLQKSKNLQSVKNRLEKMLPDIAKDLSNIASDDAITYSIHHTFTLKTLKQFDEIIQRVTNPEIKRKLIEEKYRQCSYNQCIGEDMISTNFTPAEAIILDEPLIMDLLDVKDVEYSYDKNEELYVLGNLMIYEMINKRHPTIGYKLYRRICLKEILRNINDENIFGLEEQYNRQLQSNKCGKKKEKSLRIKPIFKTLKPKYKI